MTRGTAARGKSITHECPSPLAECDAVIASIAAKADKNKRRARWSSTLLTGATASIPVALLVPPEFAVRSFWYFFFGRLLPGLLAAAAAVLSRWIQIEQPHQRWTLYRHWQRFFEAERSRYRQKIGRYSKDDREDVLTEVLAQGQIDLDDEWATLVPRSKQVSVEIARAQ
jgi:hypothetical protein